MTGGIGKGRKEGGREGGRERERSQVVGKVPIRVGSFEWVLLREGHMSVIYPQDILDQWRTHQYGNLHTPVWEPPRM